MIALEFVASIIIEFQVDLEFYYLNRGVLKLILKKTNSFEFVSL